MQVVNPANIETGHGNLEENGLYALLISRQEEIIGLVKPSLPKSTMKPRVIHITVISLVSLCIYYYCYYSIVCSVLLVAVPAAHIKCINLSIVLYLSCTLHILMTTNIIIMT